MIGRKDGQKAIELLAYAGRAYPDLSWAVRLHPQKQAILIVGTLWMPSRAVWEAPGYASGGVPIVDSIAKTLRAKRGEFAGKELSDFKEPPPAADLPDMPVVVKADGS